MTAGGYPGGRIRFRPGASAGAVGGVDGGFNLDAVRDGVLFVPETAGPAAPVMVFFHGAGGDGRRELRAVLPAAERYGAVIAAPDSRGLTWDIVSGSFGPDVAFVDRVLDAVAQRCDVDFNRLAMGGISDGASYALSLGLTNGDVFRHILAFSPGGILAGALTGHPQIFVSHGTADPILPIDVCARPLVRNLETAGYDVTYREFDGGHTVPAVVADAAFRWWLNTDDAA